MEYIAISKLTHRFPHISEYTLRTEEDQKTLVSILILIPSVFDCEIVVMPFNPIYSEYLGLQKYFSIKQFIIDLYFFSTKDVTYQYTKFCCLFIILDVR